MRTAPNSVLGTDHQASVLWEGDKCSWPLLQTSARYHFLRSKANFSFPSWKVQGKSRWTQQPNRGLLHPPCSLDGRLLPQKCRLLPLPSSRSHKWLPWTSPFSVPYISL